MDQEHPDRSFSPVINGRSIDPFDPMNLYNALTILRTAVRLRFVTGLMFQCAPVTHRRRNFT
jgi:hypothetical protein